jgi:hypothetical protein
VLAVRTILRVVPPALLLNGADNRLRTFDVDVDDLKSLRLRFNELLLFSFLPPKRPSFERNPALSRLLESVNPRSLRSFDLCGGE